MEISSIYQVDRTGTEGLAAARRAAETGGASFGAVLAKAKAGATAETAGTEKSAEQIAADTKAQLQARKAAEGLVTHALILPMLKQLRHESLGQKGVFAPGTGEKTFGPEFDMQIAERIAQSPKMGVTASLTQRLMKKHLAATAK